MNPLNVSLSMNVFQMRGMAFIPDNVKPGGGESLYFSFSDSHNQSMLSTIFLAGFEPGSSALQADATTTAPCHQGPVLDSRKTYAR
jgi:hypothetical protein